MKKQSSKNGLEDYQVKLTLGAILSVNQHALMPGRKIAFLFCHYFHIALIGSSLHYK